MVVSEGRFMRQETGSIAAVTAIECGVCLATVSHQSFIASRWVSDPLQTMYLPESHHHTPFMHSPFQATEMRHMDSRTKLTLLKGIPKSNDQQSQSDKQANLSAREGPSTLRHIESRHV